MTTNQRTDILPAIPPAHGKHARAALLTARSLSAQGRGKTVFGPLNLTLSPGDICIAHGADGSGKSTLLLALSGRFRRTKGKLDICGIDAIAYPHQAKEHTAVARLGNYVALEDRLTVGESITERAYLDGIALREAEKRVEEIEKHMGYVINRDVEIEELPPLVRLILAIALVSLRPAAVIVADDADTGIPPHLRPRMYSLLRQFAALDGSAIVLSCLDDVGAPDEAIRIHLDGGRIADLDTLLTPLKANEDIPVSDLTPDGEMPVGDKTFLENTSELSPIEEFLAHNDTSDNPSSTPSRPYDQGDEA